MRGTLATWPHQGDVARSDSVAVASGPFRAFTLTRLLALTHDLHVALSFKMVFFLRAARQSDDGWMSVHYGDELLSAIKCRYLLQNNPPLPSSAVKRPRHDSSDQDDASAHSEGGASGVDSGAEDAESRVEATETGVVESDGDDDDEEEEEDEDEEM